jgi:hypothetical protein
MPWKPPAPEPGRWARGGLRRALAEVCASLRGGAEVLGALEEMGVTSTRSKAKSALRAGEMHRRHRQRGAAARSLDDFMVGAHAMLQCDGLITRRHVLPRLLQGPEADRAARAHRPFHTHSFPGVPHVEAYRHHVAERAALGIPPLPLTRSRRPM